MVSNIDTDITLNLYANHVSVNVIRVVRMPNGLNNSINILTNSILEDHTLMSGQFHD